MKSEPNTNSERRARITGGLLSHFFSLLLRQTELRLPPSHRPPARCGCRTAGPALPGAPSGTRGAEAAGPARGSQRAGSRGEPQPGPGIARFSLAWRGAVAAPPRAPRGPAAAPGAPGSRHRRAPPCRRAAPADPLPAACGQLGCQRMGMGMGMRIGMRMGMKMSMGWGWGQPLAGRAAPAPVRGEPRPCRCGVRARPGLPAPPRGPAGCCRPTPGRAAAARHDPGRSVGRWVGRSAPRPAPPVLTAVPRRGRSGQRGSRSRSRSFVWPPSAAHRGGPAREPACASARPPGNLHGA